MSPSPPTSIPPHVSHTSTQRWTGRSSIEEGSFLLRTPPSVSTVSAAEEDTVGKVQRWVLNHTHTHMHARTRVHTHTCAYARARAHTRTHTYTQAHAHAHKHTQTQIRTLTPTHIDTYTHRHTHTHIRSAGGMVMSSETVCT